MAFWRAKRNTIVFKISMIVTMVMAAMIALLIIYNAYSYSAASRNMREQQLRVMSVHTQQIRTVLSSATTVLDELMLDNLGQTTALLNASAIRKYIVSINLAGLLSARVDRNPHLACLYFLYGDADVSLMRYSGILDWKQKFKIEDYLHTDGAGLENDAVSNEWHILNLEGSCFLLQHYRLGAANIGVCACFQLHPQRPRVYRRCCGCIGAYLQPVQTADRNMRKVSWVRYDGLFERSMPDHADQRSAAVLGTGGYQ